jgi:mono/diheme cytochrome c family protein
MNKLILPALSVFAVGRLFAADEVDFKKDIAPVLETSCVKCHNPEKKKGKLDMSTKEAFMKGGGDGKIVEPGKADESEMIKSILLPEDHDDAMPPQDKAPRPTAAQIEALKKWINAGAAWPDGVTLKAVESK